MASLIINRPAPYAETLQFKPSAEAPRFTDESKIGGCHAPPDRRKIKDVFKIDDDESSC
jgi:hypothetical protein